MRVPAFLLAVVLLLSASAAASAATVTVRSGDTLSHIAARNSVGEHELARLNGIADPDHLRAGEVLRLPGASAAVSAPPRARRHRVRRGDTLSHLAARYGTTVAALVRANRLRSPGHIRLGSTLTIPGGSAGATAPTGSTDGRHRVRRGETLDGIARRYGLSARALAATNGIRNPNRVRAGRVLRLPAAASGGAVAPAPRPSSARVVDLLASASARHGVDPALARAIAWQESGFNQRAVSSAGAVGVMQLMPATARWVGQALLGRSIDRRNVVDNVEGGVAYLAYLQRTTPSLRAAIGSYYQGQGSYRRDGAFDDTKRYVASVLALMRR